MSTTEDDIPKTFKRPGWKLIGDAWTKDGAHGVRYICAYCGREALGSGFLERNHRDDCSKYGERIQEEREQRARQRRHDDLLRRALAVVSAWDDDKLDAFLREVAP